MNKKSIGFFCVSSILTLLCALASACGLLRIDDGPGMVNDQTEIADEKK